MSPFCSLCEWAGPWQGQGEQTKQWAVSPRPVYPSFQKNESLS